MSVYVPSALKRRVREHFKLRCAYCQSQESLTVVTFEVEHIVPVSLGGATEFTNLCLSCPACNRFKSNKLVGLTDDGFKSTLYHPQLDVWPEHFDWTVGGSVIVGITDVGKATVKTLKMNRPQVVEVRSLWIEAGRHPPE